jgi:hypothetical protein
MTSFNMQYKYLLSAITLAETMASTATAAVLNKRHCNSSNRQFCCAVEKTPDQEILPNLYLFVYGIGCSKSLGVILSITVSLVTE